MPIEVFTKAEFEAALPRCTKFHSTIPFDAPLWEPQGLVKGEYCYTILVKPGVEIYIRSTVHATGIAASVAKDSIRCYLANPNNHRPIAPKTVRPTRWITRVKGWDERMKTTLRKLWRIGAQMGKCRQVQVDAESWSS